MKLRTESQYKLISKNMIKYGGSFFKIIGKALLHADNTNRQRLANAFAKDFAKYEDFKT